MKKVNFYSADTYIIKSRLRYLEQNYEGVMIKNIMPGLISLHDTNKDGRRKIILEYENRKEIITLTGRNYYAKIK